MAIFDQTKINAYLQNLKDEKTKMVVKKIVESTIYISTKQMIEMVQNAFSIFLKNHNKYNIYIPSQKIGSEHFILIQLANILHPERYLIGNLSELDNNYPIILIDDCIYSGCHMCGQIDNITYNTSVVNEFYCIVAVTSGCHTQLENDFNATIIASLNLSHLRVDNLISTDFEWLYKTLGCETLSVLPLIFEHKIANAFGSYQFYHTMLHHPIDRSCINILTWEDIKKLKVSKETWNSLSQI